MKDEYETGTIRTKITTRANWFGMQLNILLESPREQQSVENSRNIFKFLIAWLN